MKIPKLLLYTLLAGLFLTSCGLSSKADGAGDNVSTSEVVDLGLSVKWATCNLGATKPEDYGNYYAWGETKPKERYKRDNSNWYCVDNDVLMSKGVIDGCGNLTATYDAATANLGAGWRMPTVVEMIELKSNCSWIWTSMNGVKGYKVTGPSDKSIFLPAAGGRDGSESLGDGNAGAYWSSAAYDIANSNSSSYGYIEYAYGICFNSDVYLWSGSHRYYGHCVRPVSE